MEITLLNESLEIRRAALDCENLEKGWMDTEGMKTWVHNVVACRWGDEAC